MLMEMRTQCLSQFAHYTPAGLYTIKLCNNSAAQSWNGRSTSEHIRAGPAAGQTPIHCPEFTYKLTVIRNRHVPCSYMMLLTMFAAVPNCAHNVANGFAPLAANTLFPQFIRQIYLLLQIFYSKQVNIVNRYS